MWTLCKVSCPFCPGIQGSASRPPMLNTLACLSSQETPSKPFPSLSQGPSQLLHLLCCGCFPLTSCQAGLQRASPACFRPAFGAQQWIHLIGCGWIQGVLHKACCFLLLGKLVLSCLFLLLSLDASLANLSRAQCPQPVCDSH